MISFIVLFNLLEIGSVKEVLIKPLSISNTLYIPFINVLYSAFKLWNKMFDLVYEP